MDARFDLAPRGVRREHEADRMAAEMIALAYQRLLRTAHDERPPEYRQSILLGKCVQSPPTLQVA